MAMSCPASDPLSFEPGTHWQYSMSHDVLAAVVEVISGKRFSDYVRDNIFLPLGMNDSFYHTSPRDDNRFAQQYMFVDSDETDLGKLQSAHVNACSGGRHVNYGIHRRDSFRGEAKLVEQLREKANVEFVLNASVTELLGENELRGIVVEQEGQRRVIDVAGLFVAIGHRPDNGAFASLMELDEAGYALAGEDCLTRSAGVFVAGDCRRKGVHQLTTAVADGAVAALAACNYLG